MRARASLPLLASAFALAASLLPAAPARADVPRACVREHPSYDRQACVLAMREERRRVLPLVRRRTLDADRDRHERAMPLQDAERNQLLREIRDALRAREGETP